MDEGVGVNHFDGAAGGQCGGGVSTDGFRGGHAQNGTKSFSAGIDGVGHGGRKGDSG